MLPEIRRGEARRKNLKIPTPDCVARRIRDLRASDSYWRRVQEDGITFRTHTHRVQFQDFLLSLPKLDVNICRVVGRVFLSLIKLTQDKRDFLF